MLKMIKRILGISGKYKFRIILGIIFNILKSFSVALILMAVYVVLKDLDSLNGTIILKAIIIIVSSTIGRFVFDWLMNVTMSATGFDIFRDYRLNVGDRLKKAPMGYFSEQRLGTIQTILTSTVVELEQYSMLAITDITAGVSMAICPRSGSSWTRRSPATANC